MISPTELLLLRWNTNLTRSVTGSQLIPPLFVAEQGPSVHIVDIRPLSEATGTLGYIPGSAFLGVEHLEGIARENAGAAPLVIVSTNGEAASEVAKQLEEQGMKNVAAMAGGLVAWRANGLSTSRDSEGVREALNPVIEVGTQSGPLTLEQVREHIGDPRSVHWIKLSSMIAHGRFSCIDGRDERSIVGAPGGDGGEFLLSLAAIEQATGRKLDNDTVERGLLARLDTFGHFYMHTDVHAFEALTKALQADPGFQSAVSGVTTPEEWSGFLGNVAPELREPLLEHLVNPAHIGCGHIRLMLQHSDEYGIRKELVVSFLRAFYHLWWEGAPEVDLTTLPCDHGEGAVVNVNLAEEIDSLSRIPLVSPSCGGQQMFVNHPGVSNYLRRETVRFLARSAGPLSLDPSQEGKLQESFNELAARQLGTTAGYLAKGLPIVAVVFAEDGSFEVKGESQ